MGLTANVADIADVSDYLQVVAFLSRAYASVLVAYQDTNAIAPALPPLHKLADTRQKASAEKARNAINQAFQTLRNAPHLLSTHQQQIVDNCRSAWRCPANWQANLEKANTAHRAMLGLQSPAKRAELAAAAAADAAAFAAAPTGGDRRQVPALGTFSFSFLKS